MSAPPLNLVTGGAGFIGSHLVAALLARGESVRILDNFSTGNRDNLRGLAAAQLLEGDVRDPAACRRACDGVEYVFHHAALPSVPLSLRDPRLVHDVCAGGTLNILEAARDAGVRRVIYAASSSAYGDDPALPKHERMPPRPRSPYAAAKLAGEHYAAAFHACYGLETVSLRYFNVYGPRQDPASLYSGVVALFLRHLRNGEPGTIFGDGETSRDFVYVDDVVAANLLAREAPAAPGNVYNIGAGVQTTIRQLHAAIAAILGRDIPPRFAPQREGDVRHSLADLTGSNRDLGYVPQVAIEAGLRLTAAAQP